MKIKEISIIYIPSVPAIDPGTIPFTLIFLGPNSTAKALVKLSIPALAAPA